MTDRIATKEDFILEYLNDSGALLDTLFHYPWIVVDIKDDLRPIVVDFGKPELAYYWSLKVEREPSDDLREIACNDPETAYLYAKWVDHKPRKDTWEAVCAGIHYYKYAYRQYFNDIGEIDFFLTIDK